MAILPPSSQAPADRPISFLLDDEVSGSGPLPAITMLIRPESLTRDDPSRINVVQTLNGGAWADDFGPGIAVINISGTTGWRRTAGSNDDGEARFFALRTMVYDEWHRRRKQAVSQAKDPNEVRLIFSDSLDNIVASVAVTSFKLARSRSQPLLFRYQIQMLVLSDSPGAPVGPPLLGDTTASQSALSSLGLQSLDASLRTIQKFAVDSQYYVEREVLSPVNAFLGKTQEIYGQVSGTWDSVRGVSNSLISVANSSAAAGANLFRTFSLIANTPELVKAELIRVGAAYGNIFCVMRNALNAPSEFTAWSELYGASNCSSTSGGRPLSQFLESNTMEALVPAPRPPIISVSPQAQASLVALASSDVVLAPMSVQTAGTHAGNIGTGIAL